jgi:hypothetical protein
VAERNVISLTGMPPNSGLMYAGAPAVTRGSLGRECVLVECKRSGASVPAAVAIRQSFGRIHS